MRAFLLALVLLVPSAALAQDPAPQVLPETVITASPPRPHVFVMLPRGHVRFDHADAPHHAVDRIVDSVRHDPF